MLRGHPLTEGVTSRSSEEERGRWVLRLARSAGGGPAPLGAAESLLAGHAQPWVRSPQPLQGRAVRPSLRARGGRGWAVPRDASSTLGVTPAAGPFLTSAARPAPRPPQPMVSRCEARATSTRFRTRQSPPARRRPPRHWLPRPSVRPPSRPPSPVSLVPSSFTPCHRGAGDSKGVAASASAALPRSARRAQSLHTGPGPAPARTHRPPAPLHPNEAPTPHSGEPNSRPRPGVWRQHATPPGSRLRRGGGAVTSQRRTASFRVLPGLGRRGGSGGGGRGAGLRGRSGEGLRGAASCAGRRGLCGKAEGRTEVEREAGGPGAHRWTRSRRGHKGSPHGPRGRGGPPGP